MEFGRGSRSPDAAGAGTAGSTTEGSASRSQPNVAAKRRITAAWRLVSILLGLAVS
jgi:hypothetical protein